MNIPEIPPQGPVELKWFDGRCQRIDSFDTQEEMDIFAKRKLMPREWRMAYLRHVRDAI